MSPLKPENKAKDPIQFIFEEIPLGLAAIDSRGIFVSLNSKFLEFQKDKIESKIMGKDSLKIPFYKESGLDKLIRQALKGEKFEKEVSFISSMGARSSFSYYRGIPVFAKDNKKVEGILLILEDITEKKRLEIDLEDYLKKLQQEQSRFLASINSLSLGFIIIDVKNNILIKNKATDYILDLPHLTGEIFLIGDLVLIEEKLKGSFDLHVSYEKCMKEKKPIDVKEVGFGNKFLRLFLAPVILSRDSQEVIGAVILIEDITGEKLIDKMRTEIVSITSHQLRTPLTVIKGSLEMLLSGDLGKIAAEQEEVLKEAFMGNERMIKLVNELMDVTKVTEGRLELNVAPAHLEDLISESITELMPFAERNKVSLTYQKPANPLSEVKVDAIKIKQILQNLIDNAIKYSQSSGQGQVSVLIEEDKNSKCLKVVVKDNGTGIPVAEQVKIFERFFRASNVSSLDPGGGTGLGLYINKAIVELLGGKIWFESEGEEKGTSFYFTIPISTNNK